MTVFAIDSEPGDMTHYQYVLIEHYDDYCITPLGSTFRFPQKLNWWEIKDADEEKIIEIADREHCNPWTVKEVIAAIKEMRSNR
jgi:hypothetical protein